MIRRIGKVLVALTSAAVLIVSGALWAVDCPADSGYVSGTP